MEAVKYGITFAKQNNLKVFYVGGDNTSEMFEVNLEYDDETVGILCTHLMAANPIEILNSYKQEDGLNALSDWWSINPDAPLLVEVDDGYAHAAIMVEDDVPMPFTITNLKYLKTKNDAIRFLIPRSIKSQINKNA